MNNANSNSEFCIIFVYLKIAMYCKIYVAIFLFYQKCIYNSLFHKFMPARDKYHNEVCTALQNEGWEITHDPYKLKTSLFSRFMLIDVGAERILAEKEAEKIAVEIKTFGSESLLHDFYNALGQVLNYQLALNEQEPDRKLILAIPEDAYAEMQKEPLYEVALGEYKITYFVYNANNQTITLWKN